MYIANIGWFDPRDVTLIQPPELTRDRRYVFEAVIGGVNKVITSLTVETHNDLVRAFRASRGADAQDFRAVELLAIERYEAQVNAESLPSANAANLK